MVWTRDPPPADTPDPTARFTPLTAASTIVGVVPDMPVTVRAATVPTFYWVVPNSLNVLSIKMTGQDMPATIKAIADAWKKTGNMQPIQESFMSQSRLNLYLDLIIQGVTVGVCAVIAVLIACLGLFALSAYTTERRTKEIGVRKVMGADTRQVVLLLLWQFTIPVLAASAIAIPVGLVAMTWWLHGFVYHVALSVWTFVLSAVVAVGIAWLTVSWQSFVVARARPVGALRYE
jgi:putative ABC transport system permease protein